MVGRPGISRAITVTAANVHDSVVVADLVEASPSIKRERGRPRKRPGKRHADQGDDDPRGRRPLPRRGIEASERLGRHRWVVNRTFAWLSRFRRLTICDERRAAIHLAVLRLACTLVCSNYLQNGFR